MNWLQRQPFYIKLTNNEYWPMWAIYLPIIIYYPYYSLRSGSFAFFSATNPCAGGMLGASKKVILDKIDAKYKAVSLLIYRNTPLDDVLKIMKNHQVDFPIVAKPNVGERGMLVEKLDSVEELKIHLTKNNIDYIIQPFIDYEEELAIMYWRMPNEKKSKIYSVARKEFLSFTGDGKRTLREMILDYPRAILQYKKLEKRFSKKMDIVLPKGEKLELEPIGNHNRGTMFLDGNHLIDEAMERVVSDIAIGIDEVYFGRFDLKCRSIEDFKKGEYIAILELNGVGAEPAHIYDPNTSLLEIYKAQIGQWKNMFRIAMYNHKVRGIPFMTLKETRAYFKEMFAYHDDLDKS
ncbi:MAG: hypothetical protein AB8G11_05940 [Saprospiraceae bacterium]